jgi:DNA-binding response OmpR family regulator
LSLDRDRREVMVGPNARGADAVGIRFRWRRFAAPAGFSRLELLDKLQGDAYEGYERTIDVHIRNLRTKIEPDPRNPRYVSPCGIGIRLLAEPLTVSN